MNVSMILFKRSVNAQKVEIVIATKKPQSIADRGVTVIQRDYFDIINFFISWPLNFTVNFNVV